MQTNSKSVDERFLQEDRDRMARAERTLWSAAGTLYRWRRFIMITTFFVAVAAVVISLLLPNWYAASARVLQPESSSTNPMSAQLLRNLPSAASALLGGASGDYARYLTILSSRSMYEAVVDSFNLVDLYDTGNDKSPRAKAVKILSENVDFPVDEDFEFLSVVVVDKDPQLAADMANFMVRRLNQRNAELSSQSASNYRRFVERRYLEAQTALDSVLNATEAFQKQHGIYDLPAQTEGFLEYLASMRANELQAQIQYEALRQQYGADNPQVAQLRDVAMAANRSYQKALQGQEEIMPVAQAAVPAIIRQYVDLERNRLVQMRILEVIGPLYEQARFDEERTVEAVQVVDYAVPPARKFKPKRSIIVVAATFSGALLTIIFVLAFEWWRKNYARFANRLREASSESTDYRREMIKSS